MVVWGCSPRAPLSLESGGTRAAFDDGSARLSIGGHAITIGLDALGREAAMHAAGNALARRGARVELSFDDLPGVTEWWTRDPRGLEHGVTIETRPAGEGTLVLDLAVDGVDVQGEDSIALGNLATYEGLVVTDASGAHVPAHMRTVDRHIRIEVDDARAQYPLVVDPLLTVVLEATLIPTNASATQTGSVDITADGTRAVIGDPEAFPGASGDAGAVTIFVRSGETWTQEAQLLVPGTLGLGSWVSISSDGSLLAAMSADATGTAGTVHLFSRSGSTWTVLATLAGTSARPFAPYTLALSGDGTRLFVSGGNGADVQAFTVSGATLTFETSLAGAGTGYAVIDASNGGDIVAWVTVDPMTGHGTPFVFRRTGAAWAALPLPSTAPTGATFGLAPDGSAVMFGTSSGAYVWTIGPGGANALGPVGGPNLPGSGALANGAQFEIVTGTGGGLFACPSVPEGGCVTRVVPLVDPTIQPSMVGGNGVAIDGYGQRMIATRQGRVVGAFSSPAGADVFRNGANDAASCMTDRECLNEHCNDGVCCHTDCGTSPSDCHACAEAAGGTATGTCTALTPPAAIATTCRPSAGACDVPEVCVEGNVVCPGDQVAATGTVCRTNAGACDVVERCDGTTAACPADVVMSAGAMCRAPIGPCDAPFCDGTSAACPFLNVRPTSFRCAMSRGPCEADTFCDGTDILCPSPTYRATGTACGSRMVSGACDAPDVCTGSSATCPHAYAVGTTCRASAGSCDPAETCSGTSTTCPADVNLCASIPDAGPPHDAGATPSPSASCGCRTQGRGTAWWLALVALAFVRRRRLDPSS
jgi:MYXO-CTERM domain-containing protein